MRCWVFLSRCHRSSLTSNVDRRASNPLVSPAPQGTATLWLLFPEVAFHLVTGGFAALAYISRGVSWRGAFFIACRSWRCRTKLALPPTGRTDDISQSARPAAAMSSGITAFNAFLEADGRWKGPYTVGHGPECGDSRRLQSPRSSAGKILTVYVTSASAPDCISGRFVSSVVSTRMGSGARRLDGERAMRNSRGLVWMSLCAETRLSVTETKEDGSCYSSDQ